MRDRSARQRSAWTWVAALAPAAAVLPAVSAQAGAGGWLAPLLALPGILWVDWLLGRVGGDGLAGGLCRALGSGFGRVLIIIYIMWAVVLGGVQLRISARRLAAVTPTEGAWLVGILLLMAVWFAWREPASAARWSVLMLGWLLTALGGVAVLATAQMRKENLLPLGVVGDGLFEAVGAALGVLCVRVYGSFLRGEAAPRDRKGRYLPVLACGVLAGLLLVVQGNLGTELAARLEDPLLTLSRNVGVEGAFQRAESLLASGLLPADIGLLALLLWAIRTAAGQGWQLRGGARAVVVTAATAMAGSAALIGDVRDLGRWVGTVNLVLGVGVPLILVVILRIRQGKRGAYLVPDEGKNGTY